MNCECGNPKGAQAESCSRCGFLDGRRDAARGAIGLMREFGIVTVGTVAGELGCAYSSAQKLLARLVKAGRVRRAEPDRPEDPAIYSLTC